MKGGGRKAVVGVVLVGQERGEDGLKECMDTEKETKMKSEEKCDQQMRGGGRIENMDERLCFIFLFPLP